VSLLALISNYLMILGCLSLSLAQAKDLNVPMLSEDDFLKLIATRPAGQGLSSPAAKKAPTTPRSAHKAAASKKAEPEPPSKPITVSSPPKKKSPEPKKIDLKPQQSSSSSSTAAPIRKAEPISLKMEVAEGNDQAQLPWVDKYKPTSLKQVIGKSYPPKTLSW
jgi:replication factor C subunit 1